MIKLFYLNNHHHKYYNLYVHLNYYSIQIKAFNCCEKRNDLKIALCLHVSCVKSYRWLTDWRFELRHRLSFTIRQQDLAGKHRRSHFQYCTIEQCEMTQSQSSSWRYQGLRKVIFYYGNPRGLKASKHPRGNHTIRASAYTPVISHWIQYY